ncbi:MAG: hypothetical protein ACR2QS_03565 [Woeseiaceae bacterium]
MKSDKEEDEMICGLTVDERDTLLQGLNALPDTMPPRIVWNRIRAQAEAEGLISNPVQKRPTGWMGGLAIAATVVLAVILLPRLTSVPELEPTMTEPQATTQQNTQGLTVLQALMVQSQQLESDLRAMPEEPKVMRASTVATIADIEDAITAIDFQLNDPSTQMTAEETELFWRERVRLMKSLVQLRYAQAQRASF